MGISGRYFAAGDTDPSTGPIGERSASKSPGVRPWAAHLSRREHVGAGPVQRSDALLCARLLAISARSGVSRRVGWCLAGELVAAGGLGQLAALGEL
jgi:hypothetical protein